MKRTDLIALAEKLHHVSTEETLSFDELDDIKQAADFLRQIAQAQPMAWASKNSKQVMNVTDNKALADHWRGLYIVQHGTSLVVPLYTLPLED